VVIAEFTFVLNELRLLTETAHEEILNVMHTPVLAPGPEYQIYPSPEYNSVIADINNNNNEVAFTVHH
jgi:hypothetical protein